MKRDPEKWIVEHPLALVAIFTVFLLLSGVLTDLSGPTHRISLSAVAAGLVVGPICGLIGLYIVRKRRGTR